MSNEEFREMEARPCGGGAGALVWLVLSFTAACILGWLLSLAWVRQAHAADIEKADGQFAIAQVIPKRDPNKAYIIDPNTNELIEVPQELVIKMQRERCQIERGSWQSEEVPSGTFYACIFFIKK